jgi:hypothetical protein
MGWLTSTGARRRLLRVLALCVVAVSGLATWALAAGPGGWDHLGDAGAPGTDSLNGTVSALEETPGGLYVGGIFTDAGGNANADRIARWNGSSWSAVSSSTSQISNGIVDAIATAGGKVYAGGTFQDAGGNTDADFLAVWDGTSWGPFCNASGPAFGGNVNALQIIGSTLYVGGSFQNGAGIPSADYLLACDLATGTSSATTVDPAHPFSGSVYALTADSNGTLYAGGGFINLENDPAADNVASMDGGGWHALGSSGGGLCGCAVNTFVRSLAASGTNVYVGTDAKDVSGIAQADNVVRWDGSAWHAVGSNTGGANGWFPTTTYIYALTTTGSHVFAAGSFQDANGDTRADSIARFDGGAWHPVGSDGASNGPWSGNGLALASDGTRLYAGGNFTSAGGDNQAHAVASFALAQVIAVPTPTVTPGPSAVPTPTVTPSPSPSPTPAPADIIAPKTSLRAARINQAKRKATFKFASGEAGSRFLCKLDKKNYKRCTSPKTYKRLKRGKHVFRVKARDGAGNVDRTPIVKRFKIKR